MSSDDHARTAKIECNATNRFTGLLYSIEAVHAHSLTDLPRRFNFFS
jgi:hypothetical protein